jgi:WD40 repeat protein
VVFSPDSRKLASGSYDKTVRVWSVSTGQVEQTLDGHSGLVKSVAFSPDGRKLASGSYDNTVRVWNVGTGQVEQKLEGHSGSVTNLLLLLSASKYHPFYSVESSGCWVIQNSSRILHLPWEYRPGDFAAKGSTLAIGAATGRVIFVTLCLEIKAGTI